MIENNDSGGVSIAGAANATVEEDTIHLKAQNQASSPLGDGAFLANSTSTIVMGCTIEADRDWGVLMTGSPTTTLSLNTLVDNGLGDVATL